MAALIGTLGSEVGRCRRDRGRLTGVKLYVVLGSPGVAWHFGSVATPHWVTLQEGSSTGLLDTHGLFVCILDGLFSFFIIKKDD